MTETTAFTVKEALQALLPRLKAREELSEWHQVIANWKDEFPLRYGQPSEGRIPLILVHGIHGNQWDNGVDNVQSPNLPYWQTFRTFIYYWDRTELRKKYKLYSFWYQSDEISVEKISEGFRDWIDVRTSQADGTAHKLNDGPFVLVAHSMGGLVSRALMLQTLSVGEWAQREVGERVLKLVTLATPHHGTHGANGEGFQVYPVPLCLGCLCNEADILWREYVNVIGKFYWWEDWLISTFLPNRNDLLWDNYNNSMSSCLLENNGLLPLETTYDQKIIAYGGILPATTPDRPASISDFTEECIQKALSLDEHEKLRCASVLLYEAMSDPSEYGENDGMVPISSSFFYGHDVDHHHQLTDFDHGEMKGDDLQPGSEKYTQLFDLVEQDLTSIYCEFHLCLSAPDYVTVLNPVTVSASGKIDG